jgi:hypothetical protein
MNSPEIKNFRQLKLEDRETFELYSRQDCFRSCEYSFENLFIWQGSYPVSWGVYKSSLVIINEKEGLILEPQGGYTDLEDLKLLSDKAVEAGYTGNFSAVHSDKISNTPGLYQFFDVKKELGFSDYVYKSEKLCALRGKLSKKKNLVSQFTRNNPDYEVLLLDKTRLKECLNALYSWHRTGTSGGDSFKKEQAALESAVNYFNELRLEALGVFSGGRIKAFSLFSRHGNAYLIHFEKADLAEKGAYQAINRETALYLKNKTEFINREQDLGLPGLKKAKESYRPDLMIDTYSLIRKKNDIRTQ